MALQKQEISLNLVNGGDTKINDQIDPGFKDMVNVSFSGDMTAKKVVGKTSLKILDTDLNGGSYPSINYSILSKCNNDLLALSERGVYKKIDSNTNMEFLNSMGSVGINVDKAPGEIFAYGTTKKMVVDLSENDFYTFYIYQTDGVFLEKIRTACDFNGNSAHKLCAIGDDFYFLGIGEVGGPSENMAAIYKNGLLFANLNRGNSTTVVLLDMISDGVNLYASWSVDDPTALNYLFKIDAATATVTELNVSVTIATKGNIILTNKDANNFWATYLIDGVTQFVIRQAVVPKTTLIPTFSSIGTVDKYNSAITYNGRITATAYSDSLCMFVVFERIEATARTFGYIGHIRQSNMSAATMVVGLQGKGKPFLMGKEWYAPGKLSMGDRELTVLIREGDFAVDEAVSPSLVTLPGQTSEFITTFTREPNRAFNESYEVDDFFYFGSESTNGAGIIGTSVDTHQENGAIEVGGTLITFGSIAGYFDGVEFVELGFIGQPFISNATAVGGGSLAAAAYQIVAIFTWTDIRGNLFRSSESNTYSVTAALNDQITMTINHPLITKKDKVLVEVYIRKPNQLFQLATSYELTDTDFYSKAVSILSYPATTAQILYTEPTTRENVTPLNAKCMTIYGDRLFYVSHDDENMLRYTKTKKKNIGFEFVEDFRTQVLDKSGFVEDEINSLFPMDGRILIFKDKSILYTYGSGPADDGSQNDYIEPQLVSTDVGCISQRSLVAMPDGVMFMSQKGIYIVNRKLEAVYIGAPVERFNYLTITSAILMDDLNEIRFTSLEGITLIYNYLSTQWSWVTDMPTNSSTIFNKKHTSIREDLIVIDDPTTFKLLGDFVEQQISSPWVRLKNIQGYQKAYILDIVGYYKTDHKMLVEIYYDYELYISESYTIEPLAASQYNIVSRPTNAELQSGAKTNGVYQLRIDLVRKNCEAIRVVITDIGEDLSNNNGECFALSNLTFTVGVKNGTNKLPASKSY